LREQRADPTEAFEERRPWDVDCTDLTESTVNLDGQQ